MGRIRWNVQKVAKERGIQSTIALADRLGVAYNTAIALWYGRQLRIDMGILEKVCRVLQCQPGDILEYVPDEDEGNNESLILVEPRRVMHGNTLG